MITEPFELHRPSDLSEALEIKAQTGDDSVWYAGGTELLLAMKMGVMRPLHLIDLKRIPNFSSVQITDDRIVVHGAATHAEIVAATTNRPEWKALNALFRGIGNSRVRASGTLAGNLAFAEPRSDPACYLTAVGATVTVNAKGNDERTVPLDGFVIGPYVTRLADDEVITRVEIPNARRLVYSRFKTLERPTVGVTVVAGDQAGASRVVVGAGADMPTVCLGATAALDRGESPRTVGSTAAGEVELIEDVAGSADYKAHLVSVLVERAARTLAQEKEEGIG